jgi:hypothetical protein
MSALPKFSPKKLQEMRARLAAKPVQEQRLTEAVDAKYIIDKIEKALKGEGFRDFLYPAPGGLKISMKHPGDPESKNFLVTVKEVK